MESKIIHTDSSLSTRLFAKWVTERYTFSLDKITMIKDELIDIIINDSKYKKVIKLEGEYKNYLVINDDVMIIITQKQIENKSEKSTTFFELFAKDIDIFQQYYDEVISLNKSTNTDKIIVEYHSFSISQFGSGSDIEYLKQDSFMQVMDDVYEPYLNVNMLFKQFLESKSPILQFTGKPGLGKSKLITLFIKYLLSNQKYLTKENKLKIARPATSEVLAEESFWVDLRQGNFQALILDDIDYILKERNQEITSSEDKIHNDIVNKLLTFTDGLLHQNIKILITTNVEYNKIDKALSRDFRLFDSLELRTLQHDEALSVWKNRFKLSEEVFNTIFTEDEITPAKLAKEAEKQLFSDNKELSRQVSYCKEEGISNVNKIRSEKTKKIGFSFD